MSLEARSIWKGEKLNCTTRSVTDPCARSKAYLGVELIEQLEGIVLARTAAAAVVIAVVPCWVSCGCQLRLCVFLLPAGGVPWPSNDWESNCGGGCTIGSSGRGGIGSMPSGGGRHIREVKIRRVTYCV